MDDSFTAASQAAGSDLVAKQHIKRELIRMVGQLDTPLESQGKEQQNIHPNSGNERLHRSDASSSGSSDTSDPTFPAEQFNEAEETYSTTLSNSTDTDQDSQEPDPSAPAFELSQTIGKRPAEETTIQPRQKSRKIASQNTGSKIIEWRDGTVVLPPPTAGLDPVCNKAQMKVLQDMILDELIQEGFHPGMGEYEAGDIMIRAFKQPFSRQGAERVHKIVKQEALRRNSNRGSGLIERASVTAHRDPDNTFGTIVEIFGRIAESDASGHEELDDIKRTFDRVFLTLQLRYAIPDDGKTPEPIEEILRAQGTELNPGESWESAAQDFLVSELVAATAAPPNTSDKEIRAEISLQINHAKTYPEALMEFIAPDRFSPVILLLMNPSAMS